MDEQKGEVIGATFEVYVPLEIYKMLVNIADRKEITISEAAVEILGRWNKWALST